MELIKGKPLLVEMELFFNDKPDEKLIRIGGLGLCDEDSAEFKALDDHVFYWFDVPGEQVIGNHDDFTVVSFHTIDYWGSNSGFDYTYAPKLREVQSPSLENEMKSLRSVLPSA